MQIFGIFSIYLLFTLSGCHSYRIIVISPRFAVSHTQFMGKIADTIAQTGRHHVVLFSPILNPNMNNDGVKYANVVNVAPSQEVLYFYGNSTAMQQRWQNNRNPFRILKHFKEFATMFALECEYILRQHDLLQQLKNEKFDLAIAEVFDLCSLGLMELFEIPAHILVSSFVLPDFAATALGVPNLPCCIPNLYAWYTDQMSYIERTANLFFNILSMPIFISLAANYEQAIFRRHFGETFIDFQEKIARASFYITNTDPLFDYPRPLIAKVLEVGGLSVPEPAPLDEKWSQVLAMRNRSVLVSFGSVMRSELMPEQMKQALLRTFDQFPDITFIWKYEIDEHNIASGHPNVVTGTWLPQSDILAHPNLVAFVTHGGMNSILEAMNRGKPVIVFPIFADQNRNGMLAQRSGFGIVLGISDIAAGDTLMIALQNIIADSRYTESAMNLSRMIAKRPNMPQEQLIRHVEFAAEFGHIPNMDPVSRKMSFIQYYMLDIIVPAVLIAVLSIIVFIYSIYRITYRIYCKFKIVKKVKAN